jgi:hypothetical protein
LEFNPGHFPNQAKMPARHSVGVCVAIVIQPLPQVFGLANVENFVRRIAHQINAGTARGVEKKLSAQPLVQGARIGQ